MTHPQGPQHPQQPGQAPPNVANLISSLDGPALQKLLSSMTQNPSAPQHQFSNNGPGQPVGNPDLSALLSGVTNQQGKPPGGPQTPTYPHQGGPPPGYPPYGGSPAPDANRGEHRSVSFTVRETAADGVYLSGWFGSSTPQPTVVQQAPPKKSGPGLTRIGGAWVGLILGAVVLVFLLIFILQNLDPARVQFLGLQAELPLGIWMLFSAIAGVLLLAIPGLGRMIQWRRAARATKR